jgi:uncharacterized protein YgbK (DUF1537 family)
VLGVGAHGLGHALAQLLAPGASVESVATTSPVCFAIASQDPVTAVQVDVLRERLKPSEAQFRDGRLTSVSIGSSPAALFRCVPERSEDMSSHLLERFADALVSSQAIDPYSTLLACGGETAQALLKRLGISELEVLGEYDDGVPVARSLTAAGRSLNLLTKSGGYGRETVLADIASSAGGGSLAASIGTTDFSAGQHVDGKQQQ